MAQQPAYVLNVGRFQELLTAHGYPTKTAFIEASGIPRRTFQTVLAGDKEFSMRTAAYFLDTFPATSLEWLFNRNPAESHLRTAVA